MHKRAPTSKPRHNTRERAKDFPSHKLISLLYAASHSNNAQHDYFRISVDFTKTLWHHFDGTLLEIAHFLGDKELAIIDDGDIPSDNFAIKMLHRLGIVGHHDEEKILGLMGSELMAWMVYTLRKPYPIGSTHELAFDYDGDTLVIREKQSPTIGCCYSETAPYIA